MTQLSERHYGGFKRGRDLMGYPQADTTGLKVLDYVDPQHEMPPVFDQLQLGSCTANATNAAFEYDAHLDGHKTGRLSRLWTYYHERQIEGSLGQGDTGAYGSDAYVAAMQFGIPAEADWKYDISTFNGPPPDKAVKDALGHYQLKKKTHLVPQTETAIKLVLSNKQTIAFGFTVNQNFEEPWDKKGVMPMPSGPVLGGHEVLQVGYLPDYPGYILTRNSWNARWGIGGYFLFPIKLLKDKSVCSDFRTIVRPL